MFCDWNCSVINTFLFIASSYCFHGVFFPMEDLKLTAEFVNIDDVFFWRMEFMMLALCDLFGMAK